MGTPYILPTYEKGSRVMFDPMRALDFFRNVPGLNTMDAASLASMANQRTAYQGILGEYVVQDTRIGNKPGIGLIQFITIVVDGQPVEVESAFFNSRKVA